MPARTLPIVRLTEACAAVRELFDARACVCAVVDPVEEALEFVAGDGTAVDGLIGQRLAVGEGIAGYVAQARVPVEVPDVRSDARWAAGLAVHEQYVPRALLGVPLLGDAGEVLGVLNVLDPSPDLMSNMGVAVGGARSALALVAAEVAALLLSAEPGPGQLV